VVVDVDGGLRPVGHHVGMGRQGLEPWPVQRLKPLVARALQLLEGLDIDLVQQRPDGLVELPDAEETHVPQRGQDIEGDILVTLDEILHGSTRTIRLQRTDPQTGQSAIQTLRVKIPPGAREAQLIRLAGKGQEGVGGGESGNLYLRVHLAKHPDFRVRDADLYYDLELTPWEAVLGAPVHVPTLDGKVSLKIPAGTTAERQFRLRGKGLPTGDGTRGDLYAKVTIQVPPQLTPKQRALWEQLAAQTTFNPRKTP